MPTLPFGPLEKTYLQRNKIYSAGAVPAVVCRLADVALKSRQAVAQYAKAVLDCLRRAWAPVVKRADAEFFPVVLHAVKRGDESPCGTFGANNDAFYCADGWGIYIDWQDFVENKEYDRAQTAGWIRYTMAHEFGHHVQQLVGISTYFDERSGRARGQVALQETRRHELQASCFASAFFGANQETLGLYGDKLDDYEWNAHSGDDDPPASTHDHGSHQSSTYWADTAFKAKSPSACNTWTAPPTKVS
ncbi:neutral zinc metallopeptidase [Kribbella sp. NPDC051586]|uniref:neutral zinc metallopeptidase n=1 Tax=Kribbella sp. NPDC051586 TaxID=3364118 RepID=UPI0037A7BFEB